MFSSVLPAGNWDPGRRTDQLNDVCVSGVTPKAMDSMIWDAPLPNLER